VIGALFAAALLFSPSHGVVSRRLRLRALTNTGANGRA
jgi:hypothetical protein